MSDLKTKPNDGNVNEFIDSVVPDWKRDDCRELLKIIGEITGEEPKMWGTSIVGFGQYHYKYKSGQEGDWFLSGFSPRKQSITIYMMGGYEGEAKDLLLKVGKHKASVGCLYINKLTDIDLNVLKKLIEQSINTIKERYNGNA